MVKLAVIAGIFSCSVLLAQPTSTPQEKLIVATEAWPPFRIDDPGRRHAFAGIDMDVLELLERRFGWSIEVQRHPFARCLEMIRAGEADLTPGIARTEDRAQYTAYVPTPYAEVQPVFYTQKGRGDGIRSYGDLYRHDVGYSLNSVYFEPFNSDRRLNKVGVSTEEQLVRMVALGRIDVIIGTNPNLAWDVKRLGLGDLVERTAYTPDRSTQIYMGFSKRSRFVSLLQEIDAYIAQIRSSGAMAEILARYR
jgi:polar amino acid transport system substrate-binding protein